MLTLFLLRHAEAASGQGHDLDRKLTALGRDQAQAVARAFAAPGAVKPALAIHSPATRIRETVAALKRAVPDMKAREVDDIYNAAPDTLYNIVRREGGDAAPLLLAGHNPGISALAGMLAGTGDPAAFQRMLSGFTPATLATIECDIGDWSGLMPDANRLVGFDYPRV